MSTVEAAPGLWPWGQGLAVAAGWLVVTTPVATFKLANWLKRHILIGMGRLFGCGFRGLGWPGSALGTQVAVEIHNLTVKKLGKILHCPV